MNYLDDAREAARPHFGEEEIIAVLPGVCAVGSRTTDTPATTRISDRFLKSQMVLVLGTDRLGIFHAKPLRFTIGSFIDHVALTDIDSVFIDRLKFFFKFSQLTLSFKDRSFVVLEMRRNFHPERFAALIARAKGPGEPGPSRSV